MNLSYMEAVRQTVKRCIEIVMEAWQKIKSWLLFLRKRGDRQEQRFAWEVLHSSTHRRKINAKRRMIVQRKVGIA